MISESELYRQELYRARESVNEWDKLGRKLNKHADPEWKLIRGLRIAQTEYLESLAKRPHRSLPSRSMEKT